MDLKGVFYVAINYLSQIFSVIINLLLIKGLSSNELGIVSFARIFFQIPEFTQLGLRSALDRHLPFLGSKRSRLYFSSCFYLYLLVSFFYLFIVFINSSNFIYSLFAISGVFFVVSNFFKVYFRARGEIKNLNISSFSLSVLPIVIQITFFYFYGFYGFLYSFFLGYIFVFLFLIVRYRGVLYKINLRKCYFIYKRKMVGAGTVLYINSLLIFMIFTIDRVIAGKYLGFAFLGEYSVVLFFLTVFILFPSVISELMMNRIYKEREGDGANLLFRCIIYTSLISLLIIFLFFCFGQCLVDFFIPEYSSLMNGLYFSSLILVPYSVTPFLNHYMNSINKYFMVFKVNLVACFIYFLFIFIYFYFFNVSIDFLIISKVICFFIQALLMILSTLICMTKDKGVLNEA